SPPTVLGDGWAGGRTSFLRALRASSKPSRAPYGLCVRTRFAIGAGSPSPCDGLHLGRAEIDGAGRVGGQQSARGVAQASPEILVLPRPEDVLNRHGTFLSLNMRLGPCWLVFPAPAGARAAAGNSLKKFRRCLSLPVEAASRLPAAHAASSV